MVSKLLSQVLNIQVNTLELFNSSGHQAQQKLKDSAQLNQGNTTLKIFDLYWTMLEVIYKLKILLQYLTKWPSVQYNKFNLSNNFENS